MVFTRIFFYPSCRVRPFLIEGVVDLRPVRICSAVPGFSDARISDALYSLRLASEILKPLLELDGGGGDGF